MPGRKQGSRCRDGVRKVRPNQNCVSIGSYGKQGTLFALPVFVEPYGAKLWRGHVTIVAVPLDVLLDECRAMAKAGERLEEIALCSSLTVSPGGRHSTTVDDDRHAKACSAWIAAKPGMWSQSAKIAAEHACRPTLPSRLARHSLKAKSACDARNA